MGTLSLLAHQPLPGYEALPDYPEEQPDPSVRDVEELEGWAGSRTVAVEQGFGSDSFESRYRNTAMASTAFSGIEATGYHGGHSAAAAKTKSGDYDLDAFYNDDSSDEYEIDDTSSEEEDSDEEETDSEEEDDESTDESTDEDEEASSEEYTSSEEEEEDDHHASSKRIPLHKK